MPQFVQTSTRSFIPFCEPVKENRFSYLTLNMNHTLNALNGRSSNKWIQIAQSIARIAIFPLLLIAAFEAIVKNGFFLFVNLGVALANKIYQILYPQKKTNDIQITPLDIPEIPTVQIPASNTASQPVSDRAEPLASAEVLPPPSLPLDAAANAGAPNHAMQPDPNAIPVLEEALVADPPPVAAAPNEGPLLEKAIEWKKIASAGAAVIGTLLLGPGATASIATTAL